MTLKSKVHSTKPKVYSIELLVQGVAGNVGESVEFLLHRLCRLLEKKMMSIALEQLSFRLCKNPYLELKDADKEFLRCFESKLGSEENKKQVNEVKFVFPVIVNDPLLVCCMFRQNICGSAYFHRLNVTEKISEYNENNFSLFYLNTPTPLNNNMQATSTLTEKGATFARHTGGGVALIKFDLLKDGEKVVNCRIDQSIGDIDQNHELDTKDVLVRRQDTSFEPTGFIWKVSIVNTTLNISYIFDWIELSLNQALLGW